MVTGPMHGIARYALELCARLPRLAPQFSYCGLTGPDGFPPSLTSLRPPFELHACRQPFLSVAEQPALAASLYRLKPSLFHATSFSLPALWNGPLVATLHDANHLDVAESRSPKRTAYYRFIVGPRARRAKALITVSEFSRHRLSTHLRLPPERFQVISNGVSEQFTTVSRTTTSAFQQKYRLPPRFIAAIGNAKAFKNLSVLAPIATQLPFPLVIFSAPSETLRALFSNHASFLHDIDEAELPAAYAAAEMLVFPSRYEGFGLPALEAMACGTPVIVSDTASLPEVVGQAALRVQPDSPAAFLEACRTLFRDLPTHRALSVAGKERAARFSWDTCAQQTAIVYQRVLDSRR
jgi:glycosyltransferase involved in cell wall biosynthesis